MRTDDLNPYESPEHDARPIERISASVGWRVVAASFFAIGLAVTTLGATVFTLALTYERDVFDYHRELPELLGMTTIGIAWLMVGVVIWHNYSRKRLLAVLFAIPIPMLLIHYSL